MKRNLSHLCASRTFSKWIFDTTSPLIRIKSELINCFESNSLKASPTERASGVTIVIILNGEYDRFHFDALIDGIELTLILKYIKIIGINYHNSFSFCYSQIYSLYIILNLFWMFSTKKINLLYTSNCKKF